MSHLKAHLQPALVCSLPAMRDFAQQALHTHTVQEWDVIAAAMQIGKYRQDKKLQEWSRQQATRRGAAVNPREEALMRYVMDQDPAQGLSIPGFLGHWIACQEADAAFLSHDEARFERAMERVHVIPSDAPNDEMFHLASMSIQLYDVVRRYRDESHLHMSVIQECADVFPRIVAQGLYLHIGRLLFHFYFSGRHDYDAVLSC